MPFKTSMYRKSSFAHAIVLIAAGIAGLAFPFLLIMTLSSEGNAAIAVSMAVTSIDLILIAFLLWVWIGTISRLQTTHEMYEATKDLYTAASKVLEASKGFTQRFPRPGGGELMVMQHYEGIHLHLVRDDDTFRNILVNAKGVSDEGGLTVNISPSFLKAMTDIIVERNPATALAADRLR